MKNIKAAKEAHFMRQQAWFKGAKERLGSRDRSHADSLQIRQVRVDGTLASEAAAGMIVAAGTA